MGYVPLNCAAVDSRNSTKGLKMRKTKKGLRRLEANCSVGKKRSEAGKAQPELGLSKMRTCIRISKEMEVYFQEPASIINLLDPDSVKVKLERLDLSKYQIQRPANTSIKTGNKHGQKEIECVDVKQDGNPRKRAKVDELFLRKEATKEILLESDDSYCTEILNSEASATSPFKSSSAPILLQKYLQSPTKSRKKSSSLSPPVSPTRNDENETYHENGNIFYPPVTSSNGLIINEDNESEQCISPRSIMSPIRNSIESESPDNEDTTTAYMDHFLDSPCSTQSQHSNLLSSVDQLDLSDCESQISHTLIDGFMIHAANRPELLINNKNMIPSNLKNGSEAYIESNFNTIVVRNSTTVTETTSHNDNNCHIIEQSPDAVEEIEIVDQVETVEMGESIPNEIETEVEIERRNLSPVIIILDESPEEFIIEEEEPQEYNEEQELIEAANQFIKTHQVKDAEDVDEAKAENVQSHEGSNGDASEVEVEIENVTSNYQETIIVVENETTQSESIVEAESETTQSESIVEAESETTQSESIVEAESENLIKHLMNINETGAETDPESLVSENDSMSVSSEIQDNEIILSAYGPVESEDGTFKDRVVENCPMPPDESESDLAYAASSLEVESMKYFPIFGSGIKGVIPTKIPASNRRKQSFSIDPLCSPDQNADTNLIIMPIQNEVLEMQSELSNTSLNVETPCSSSNIVQIEPKKVSFVDMFARKNGKVKSYVSMDKTSRNPITKKSTLTKTDAKTINKNVVIAKKNRKIENKKQKTENNIITKEKKKMDDSNPSKNSVKVSESQPSNMAGKSMELPMDLPLQRQSSRDQDDDESEDEYHCKVTDEMVASWGTANSSHIVVNHGKASTSRGENDVIEWPDDDDDLTATGVLPIISSQAAELGVAKHLKSVVREVSRRLRSGKDPGVIIGTNIILNKDKTKTYISEHGCITYNDCFVELTCLTPQQVRDLSRPSKLVESNSNSASTNENESTSLLTTSKLSDKKLKSHVDKMVIRKSGKNWEAHNKKPKPESTSRKCVTENRKSNRKRNSEDLKLKSEKLEKVKRIYKKKLTANKVSASKINDSTLTVAITDIRKSLDSKPKNILNLTSSNENCKIISNAKETAETNSMDLSDTMSTNNQDEDKFTVDCETVEIEVIPAKRVVSSSVSLKRAVMSFQSVHPEDEMNRSMMRRSIPVLAERTAKEIHEALTIDFTSPVSGDLHNFRIPRLPVKKFCRTACAMPMEFLPPPICTPAQLQSALSATFETGISMPELSTAVNSNIEEVVIESEVESTYGMQSTQDFEESYTDNTDSSPPTYPHSEVSQSVNVISFPDPPTELNLMQSEVVIIGSIQDEYDHFSAEDMEVASEIEVGSAVSDQSADYYGRAEGESSFDDFQSILGDEVQEEQQDENDVLEIMPSVHDIMLIDRTLPEVDPSDLVKIKSNSTKFKSIDTVPTPSLPTENEVPTLMVSIKQKFKNLSSSALDPENLNLNPEQASKCVYTDPNSPPSREENQISIVPESIIKDANSNPTLTAAILFETSVASCSPKLQDSGAENSPETEKECVNGYEINKNANADKLETKTNLTVKINLQKLELGKNLIARILSGKTETKRIITLKPNSEEEPDKIPAENLRVSAMENEYIKTPQLSHRLKPTEEAKNASLSVIQNAENLSRPKTSVSVEDNRLESQKAKKEPQNIVIEEVEEEPEIRSTWKKFRAPRHKSTSQEKKKKNNSKLIPQPQPAVEIEAKCDNKAVASLNSLKAIKYKIPLLRHARPAVDSSAEQEVNPEISENVLQEKEVAKGERIKYSSVLKPPEMTVVKSASKKRVTFDSTTLSTVIKNVEPKRYSHDSPHPIAHKISVPSALPQSTSTSETTIELSMPKQHLHMTSKSNSDQINVKADNLFILRKPKTRAAHVNSDSSRKRSVSSAETEMHELTHKLEAEVSNLKSLIDGLASEVAMDKATFRQIKMAVLKACEVFFCCSKINYQLHYEGMKKIIEMIGLVVHLVEKQRLTTDGIDRLVLLRAIVMYQALVHRLTHIVSPINYIPFVYSKNSLNLDTMEELRSELMRKRREHEFSRMPMCIDSWQGVENALQICDVLIFTQAENITPDVVPVVTSLIEELIFAYKDEDLLQPILKLLPAALDIILQREEEGTIYLGDLEWLPLEPHTYATLSICNVWMKAATYVLECTIPDLCYLAYLLKKLAQNCTSHPSLDNLISNGLKLLFKNANRMDEHTIPSAEAVELAVKQGIEIDDALKRMAVIVFFNQEENRRSSWIFRRTQNFLKLKISIDFAADPLNLPTNLSVEEMFISFNYLLERAACKLGRLPRKIVLENLNGPVTPCFSTAMLNELRTQPEEAMKRFILVFGLIKGARKYRAVPRRQDNKYYVEILCSNELYVSNFMETDRAMELFMVANDPNFSMIIPWDTEI